MVVIGSGVLTQVTAAGRAVRAALEPVHNVLQMSPMAASLTPDKQSLHHMVAHCTYTGTLVAPVTYPSLVAHWPLAVAAVDVECCGRLVQAGDGAARTQLDDLIGHVPQLESLQ